MRNRRSNVILDVTTTNFPDSAPQYTHKQILVETPAQADRAEVVVANPSLISDLVVKIFNKVEFGTNPVSFLSLVPIVSPAGQSITIEKSTSTVIENCEDAWNESDPVTGVTVSADGAVFKVGTNSAKMAVGATAAVGILATEAISSTPLTAYTHVSMWIRSSIATTAGQLQFLIDNTAACASPLETIDIPALAANTWTVVLLPLSDPDALTAVISLGVKQTADLGAFNLYLDDVRAVYLNAESFILDNFLGGPGSTSVIDLSLQTDLAADQAFDAIVAVYGV